MHVLVLTMTVIVVFRVVVVVACIDWMVADLTCVTIHIERDNFALSFIIVDGCRM